MNYPTQESQEGFPHMSIINPTLFFPDVCLEYSTCYLVLGYVHTSRKHFIQDMEPI